MASILSFGRYVPERVLASEELAARLGVDPAWIVQISGIEERRIAASDETVVTLGVRAAESCIAGREIGLVIVSSASSERRFPGPAAEIAHQLGLAGIPAIDLPVASAGSLFALTLASQLAPAYGNVLVIAAEKMSAPALAEPLDKNVAILFGDGAGAAIVGQGSGLEILDSALHSDGSYAADLRLEFTGPIAMNGYSVIMQATRKIPAAIAEVLERSKVEAASVAHFLMHQANQNLIDRVAKCVRVPPERFYSNIRRYGNTSSASMLIAAAEWHETAELKPGDYVAFAAFGAGFHWGALLARQA
ncbi:MAG TPA: beta-ketoacyl-ACP synthase 3 [Bryobacteraceae bacterium]|nr:beta-ketoacyl-ACP synthase 3 [Bryobacteraceae bacterium]